MGCWNGTCMVSNLPIISGDKIKLIILSGYPNQKLSGAGYVYITGKTEPYCLPISGRYNDYGMIEDCVEDFNYQLIEKYFQELYSDGLPKDGAEILKSHSRTKPNKIPTLKDILLLIERDYEIKVKNFGMDVNLSYVMIREDVWNVLVNQVGGINNLIWGDDGKYVKVRDYYENSYTKFISHEKILNKPIFDFFGLRLFEKLKIVNIYGSFINDNINDDIKLDELRSLFVEFMIVHLALCELRKGWIIQPGAGSQNGDFGIYKKVYKELVKICTTESKRWD